MHYRANMYFMMRVRQLLIREIRGKCVSAAPGTGCGLRPSRFRTVNCASGNNPSPTIRKKSNYRIAEHPGYPTLTMGGTKARPS